MCLFCSRVVNPSHFGTDKFIPNHPTFESGGTLIFHEKRRVSGAAWNPIGIDGIVHLFQVGAGVQRNIGPGEMNPVSVRVRQLDIAFTLDGTHLNIEGYKILLNSLSKNF